MQHAAFADGRLYLFPGEEQKQKFLAHHDEYATADLALGGQCTVCLEETDREAAGTPECFEYYQGLHYLFPSPKQ